MRLEAAIPARRRLSMTSLIDVIFLLLLFFMLSSTFSKFGEIELAGASAGQGVATAAPLYLRLRGDEIAVNGEAVTLETLPNLVRQRAGQEGQTVLVSVTDKTTSQRFVDVYSALRAIPGLRVAIIR